jgi:hypothetical protein
LATGEDGLIVLEHKKSQDPVREVRKDVGEVLVRMRE